MVVRSVRHDSLPLTTTPALSNRLPSSAAAKVGLSSRWESTSSSSQHPRGQAGKPQPTSKSTKADIIDPEFSSKYGGLDDAMEEREKAPEAVQRRPQAKNQVCHAVCLFTSTY